MPTKHWNLLIQTTSREASALIGSALRIEPRLTRLGVGVLNEAYKRAAIIELELFEERVALEGQLEEVAACADWIKLQRRLNSFTAQTSFSRKCNVEAWFSVRGEPDFGVTNGAFIAAALGLDVDGRVLHAGPNMLFKLEEGPSNIAAWERARPRSAADRATSRD